MIKIKRYIISVIMLGFLLIISSPATASASVSYKLLNITGYEQEMSWWCWASCERSILNYFGFSPLPSQYQIVGTVYNPPINQGATVGQIANSLGAYGVNAASNSSSLSFSSIKSFLDNSEPIISGRASHANLIRGYYQDTLNFISNVYWIDPAQGHTRYNITPYNNYISTWNMGTVDYIWY